MGVRTMPRRPSFPRIFGAAAFCICCLCLSRPGHAEPSPSEALFEEGKRLLEEGNASAACPKLEAALRQTPEASAAGRMVLARCFEALGRLGSAWRLYRAIDRSESNREAREAAEALAPRIHRVALMISPATLALRGLHIEIDTRVVARAELELPIAVDAGPIPILVSADDREDWTMLVDVPATPGTTTIEIPALRGLPNAPLAPGPATPATPPFWTGERIAGLTLGLSGAVVLAISGGMVALAKSDYEQALIDGQCQGTAPPVCTDISGIDEARALGNATTGVFFAGLGLVGVGVVVFASAGAGATPPAPILRASVDRLELIGAW